MSFVEFRYGAARASFAVDAGANLLDQALAQDVPVNYSCRRGDCGQCAATVVEGEVSALEPGLPYRLDSRWLLCNVAARSDLRIELPYFRELNAIKVLRSPTKIDGLRLLSEDVIEVSLRVPPSTAFAFLPGQYIRLTNRDKTTRSYSLAAGASSDKLLRLHIRKVNGGRFGDWLFGSAKPGDLLQLEGPLGHFFLRDEGEFKTSLFVATGTGMAPIYAMLSSLTSEQQQRCGEIHIYWGNRVSKDAYLQQTLVELATAKGWPLHLIHSREPGSQIRHVQDAVGLQHERLDAAQIFAAGNPGMVDAMRQLASHRGLAEDNFHADPFTTS